MLIVIVSFVVLMLLVLSREIFKKNIHTWLWAYITRKPEPFRAEGPIHIMFAFCDHYEPQWGKASYSEEVARVDRWCVDYPLMVENHADADGYFPKHSFFYPEEEYRVEHLDKISSLCVKGYGEIEIHLHHDNDTKEGLSKKISGFLKTLDENHGAVVRHPETNQYQFSFIHGNWSLDNSRKDGRWCGVNNELRVLADLGCYADYTLPSAPSDTQTAKINSIYYATGEEGKSKSHNQGVDVEVNKAPSGDLMLIQGALCLNWQDRKFGLLPRIENSDIRKNSPPTEHRVDMWVNCGIQVKHKPQWRFIKIHTHGTQEHDMDTILKLDGPVDRMFAYLESRYNDGKQYVLHYVSAREMYNIAKAAEANKSGNPNDYRDFVLPKPPFLESHKE